MLLAVFLNSICIPNVSVVLISYNKPYGEPLEAIKFELDEFDIDNSLYKFMQVFDFYFAPVDNNRYLLEVRVAKY